MRTSTKEKIIRFIKRILNYKEYAQVQTLTIDNRKVHKLQSNLLLYEYEFNHHLKYRVAESFVKELIDSGLIKSTTTKELPTHLHSQDCWIVRSEILICENK